MKEFYPHSTSTRTEALEMEERASDIIRNSKEI